MNQTLKKPILLKYKHKNLYEQISSKDVVDVTKHLREISQHAEDFEGLENFNAFGKWNALMFIMHRHFSGELMSKTDIASQVFQMSRDGAMKWIDTLFEQELLYQHHDPSIAVDKRKVYIIPSRHLTQSYCEYCKQRILLTANARKDFDVLNKKMETFLSYHE